MMSLLARPLIVSSPVVTPVMSLYPTGAIWPSSARWMKSLPAVPLTFAIFPLQIRAPPRPAGRQVGAIILTASTRACRKFLALTARQAWRSALPSGSGGLHDPECDCRQAEASIQGRLQGPPLRGIADRAGRLLVSALSAQLS